MKKKSNINIALMILGIDFTLSLLFGNNPPLNAGGSSNSSEHGDDINLDNDNVKLSKLSGKIHIDNNISAVKVKGAYKGSDTYADLYIIEDLVIDGGGAFL
ncbi:MAG: hypothetical protein ACFFC1_05750 [Promethearchaeota archaeon]